jgi:deazaflavin-dependent oxidoreductase (nitroreductase family)
LTYRRTNHKNIHVREHGVDKPEIRNWRWNR